MEQRPSGERMVVSNKSYSYRKKYFSAGKVDLIDWKHDDILTLEKSMMPLCLKKSVCN